MAEIEQTREDSAIVVDDQVGFTTFTTSNGFIVFFRPVVRVSISREGVVKVGLPLPTPEPGTFAQGAAAYEKFSKNLRHLIADFSQEYGNKLANEGFTVAWKYVEGNASLKDGSSVGPGPALYLHRKGRAVDVHEVDAVALGNGMNFERDGCRVTVKSLGVGILSGDRMYEGVLEDQETKLFDVAERRAEEARLGEIRRQVWSSTFKKEVEKLQAELWEGRQQFKERRLKSQAGEFFVKVKVDSPERLILSWELSRRHGDATLSGFRIDGPGFVQETRNDGGDVVGFNGGSPIIETREDNHVPQLLIAGREYSFSFRLWKAVPAAFLRKPHLQVIDRFDFVQPMPTVEENRAWEEKLEKVLEKLARGDSEQKAEIPQDKLSKELLAALQRGRNVRKTYDDYVSAVRSDLNLTEEQRKESLAAAERTFKAFKWDHDL